MTNPGETQLLDLIVNMDKSAALDLIGRRLSAGEDPAALLDECRAGVERVGTLYEEGTYFISALVMAGTILRAAGEVIVPMLPAQRLGSGTVVVGTVKGDIHDIGKNIATAMLDSHGFRVVDLGVDVAPEQFSEAVADGRPDAVGISCLLTTGFGPARDTISLIRKTTADWDRRLPVVVGGAPLHDGIPELSDADGWCNDAAQGIQTLLELIASAGRTS